MLRLAITSARGRPGTFAGALIALFTASVLAMAWGMQLEAILRTQPPVERYAGTAAVVTGQQTVGADHDVALSERARVSSALAARLAAVPGVAAAIGDAKTGCHVTVFFDRAPARKRGPPGLFLERRTCERLEQIRNAFSGAQMAEEQDMTHAVFRQCRPDLRIRIGHRVVKNSDQPTDTRASRTDGVVK